MGLEYHKYLIQHIERMIAGKTISEEDSKLVIWTDSVEDAIDHINKCKLILPDTKLKKQKTMWILGEKHVKRKEPAI